MFLLLWDKNNKEFVHIKVSSDPYIQRMNRLYRRLLAYSDAFNLLATMTFVDTVSGSYPIKKRDLRLELPVWLGIPKNTEYYPYSGKDTLIYINYNYDGLTGYIRAFFNKIQQYFKRVYGGIITYFWVLEVGSQTKRPHVHVVLGIPIDISLKVIWEIFESKWNSGYVDLVEIESKNHVASYLSKYLSTKQVNKSFYLKEGKRSWSCSRDIPKKPKSPDFDYCGMYETLEKLLMDIGLYTWNELDKKFESMG